MGNMNLFFGLITAGCGVYCLYLWGKIKMTGKVDDGNMILPRGSTMDECLDAGEFLKVAMPRLMLFGLLILFFGLVTLGDVYFGFLNLWTEALSAGMRLLVLELVTCIIPLAVVIWFAISLRRLQNKFF